MRAVVQRVSRARVRVNGQTTGEIGPGLLILLGVGQGDTSKEADNAEICMCNSRELSACLGSNNTVFNELKLCYPGIIRVF